MGHEHFQISTTFFYDEYLTYIEFLIKVYFPIGTLDFSFTDDYTEIDKVYIDLICSRVESCIHIFKYLVVPANKAWSKVENHCLEQTPKA